VISNKPNPELCVGADQDLYSGSPAPKSWAIIPAAGIGKRMNAHLPKQYMTLNDLPVLQHTLLALTKTNLFTGIVLAAKPGDGRANAIASLFKNIIPACGGFERVHSVRNALAELNGRASPDDWVFVHDAVRPCVRPEDIIRLHQAIQDHAVGGLLGLPVRDTMKQAEAGHAIKTLDRSELWQAQTPQAFRYGLLVDAINQALANNSVITDEAQALELVGHAPLLVEGSSDNIKITYSEDLTHAEHILNQRETACA
jgi:2-C-methyl-D-erythritol 4-phosphate cytidylyltransferase